MSEKKGSRLNYAGQRWVAMEDYNALQAALREALDKWSAWNEDFDGKFKDLKERDGERIAELRKFLDDK